MTQITGSYQMQMLASQICGRQIVSFSFKVSFIRNLFVKSPFPLTSIIATVEWDGETLLRDFGIDDLGTPRAHTPSTIADVPDPMSVPPR